MRWPNTLSPESFLDKYWQKRAMFLPNAVDADLPELDANELAWLATQPDVESRLIFTDRTGGRTSYRVEQGPFEASHLQGLPASDWTLLVQDVDKHLPDFRAWFNQISFIPAWRIDDLMVSIAAPGGSVGPHKDNYDVFLCQGGGVRQWLISDDRTVPADQAIAELDLLEPFEPTEVRLCERDDVVYVPPGIPHWGVASEFCTTYSIGMRAPTQEELAAGYARIYEPESDRPVGSVPDQASLFYSDADLQVCEARGGQISIDAVRRMRKQNLLHESLSDEQLMTVLGSVVTDPKAWLDPDAATGEETAEVLRGQRAMKVHGMALLAWCETAGLTAAFVNGSARKIPKAGVKLVRALCADRLATADTVLDCCAFPEGRKFVNWLLDQGVLDTG